MAKYTGTYVTGDARGLREDLSDMIYNLSPEKTPLMTLIGRSKAKATLFEWQIDTLAAPITTNAQYEGNEATFATPAPTTRIGNYVQISSKTALVSGTLEAVDKAGRKSEMAYQMAKRSAELKRDMEATIFSNQAASGSEPRHTAGLGAWLYSNTSFGATGGDPVYTTLPNDDRTDSTAGDLRTFQESQLSSVLADAWASGGAPTHAFMGAFAKTAFSAFTGVYEKEYVVNQVKSSNAIIAAADVYVSNFGIIKVEASRWNRITDVYIIDPDYISVAYLRPFKVEDLAKTGDAVKKEIVVEWGLKVNNEAAHAGIFDLKSI